MIYALRTVSFLRQSSNNKCITALLQRRFVKINPIRATTVTTEDFEEKNARLNRPMSPHVTIYKFPMPALMSITHRATGIMLIGYVFAFGIVCRFYGVTDFVNLMNSLQLSSTTWIACKSTVVFPFMYHLFNGLRHLVWDIGFGLAMKSVYTTGYVVLALSVLGSVFFAAYVK